MPKSKLPRSAQDSLRRGLAAARDAAQAPLHDVADVFQSPRGDVAVGVTIISAAILTITVPALMAVIGGVHIANAALNGSTRKIAQAKSTKGKRGSSNAGMGAAAAGG